MDASVHPTCSLESRSHSRQSLAVAAHRHMSGRRSQGNHEAVSQLLETAVPPLSPEAVTRKRAEAEAAAAQNKANNAAREQELMELGELHESLVSQLPTRVRFPVKAEKRRAPPLSGPFLSHLIRQRKPCKYLFPRHNCTLAR